MEFVLIVPLLALLVGLTFFFGWAVINKHGVLVADRYSAWRRVETGAWPSEEQINDVAFNARASTVHLDAEAPITETVDELVSEAASRGQRSQELADQLVVQRFPRGAMATVSASFRSNRAIWERFVGDIRHRHGREGVTWRRDEVNCWNALRDLYYSDLDQSLQGVPAPGDRMAGMIRGLYLTPW